LERRLAQFDSGERNLQPDDRADAGQRPLVFECPGLTAQPWWPVPSAIRIAVAETFPAVQREARALLVTNQSKTRHGSYVSGDAEDDGWLSTDFVRDGRWQEETCLQCPATVALLKQLPLCECSLSRAYFSTLTAGKSIRPHHGRANVKLRMQLPLYMTPGPDSEATHCEMSVGGVSRSYNIGLPHLFDDCFLHEVHNRCSSDRVVLLCDLWHPELSLQQIARICRSFPATTADATAARDAQETGATVWWCTRCKVLFAGAECPRGHPSFRYTLPPPELMADDLRMHGSRMDSLRPTTTARERGRPAGEQGLRLRLREVLREVAQLKADIQGES
jgi:hypothetical protein